MSTSRSTKELKRGAGKQQVALGRMAASMSRDTTRSKSNRKELGKRAARDLVEGTRKINKGY